ncbi:MAG: YegS/Rv2252/BmrU family lipid kinase [Chitinophagia bacterium]|nr:YegS/Rv2252/BmrU family lipid kinase [Chitinophagia bacterium]
MKRRIIYFINPISGTSGKSFLIKKIEEKTTLQGIPFEILNTNAKGDYQFLKEKILREQITDIVICGGDGTVSKIAGTLLNEKVNIGIIPTGSGNGLALAAKIPTKIDSALALIFKGDASFVDSFSINGNFSCMLCGLGFDAQVANDFSNQSSRGLVTYIKQTIINFIKMRPSDFEISYGGQFIHTSAFFISIANSNQFGNQFTIAPKASLTDGLLDIVVVKKMPKYRFLWSVLKQVLNGKLKDYDESAFHKEEVLYFQTDRLTIKNKDAAPLHIDGDPCNTSNEFKIEVIPNAFKLLHASI